VGEGRGERIFREFVIRRRQFAPSFVTLPGRGVENGLEIDGLLSAVVEVNSKRVRRGLLKGSESVDGMGHGGLS
jgi:hypothetical protein